MVLRLVNALDVPLLFVVQISMNVLLQDFEITRHGVQRRAKLVTETREQLGLNAICGFCLLAGALLALECELQFTRSLGDAGVQRSIERLHALLGLTSRAEIAEQPTEGAFSVSPGFERGDSCLHGYETSVAHPDLEHPFVEVDSVGQRAEVRPEFLTRARIDKGKDRFTYQELAWQAEQLGGGSVCFLDVPHAVSNEVRIRSEIEQCAITVTLNLE